jgi:hypothetical protein
MENIFLLLGLSALCVGDNCFDSALGQFIPFELDIKRRFISAGEQQ